MAKLSAEQVRQIIERRPQGVAPEEVVQILLDKGHTLEPAPAPFQPEVSPQTNEAGISPVDPLTGLAQLGSLAKTGVETVGQKISDYGAAQGMGKVQAAGGLVSKAGALIPSSKVEVLGQLAVGPLLKGAGIVGKAVLQPFAGKLTATALRKMALAEAAGVPISAAEATGSKTLAMTESVLEKTPFAADIIRKFRERQLKAMTATREGIMGRVGSPVSLSEAGDMARSGARRNSIAFADKATKLYDKIGKLVGTELIPANKIRKVATEIAQMQARLPAASQDKELVGLVKELAEFENYDWPSLQGIRSDLNARIAVHDAGTRTAIAGIRGMSDVTARGVRMLKNAITKDLGEFSALKGGLIKEAFDTATSYYAENKTLWNGPVVRRLASKATGLERIVDMIFRPKNASAILETKRVVGPEAFKAMRGKFVESLMPIKEAGAMGEVFNLNKFRSNLAKFQSPGDTTLEAIFGKSELKEIMKVGNVASLTGAAERLAGNPSGTGQMVIAAGEFGLLLTNPMSGLKVVLGAPALAALYTSKAGRQWLTTGLYAPVADRLANKTFQNIVQVLTRAGVQVGAEALGGGAQSQPTVAQAPASPISAPLTSPFMPAQSPTVGLGEMLRLSSDRNRNQTQIGPQ